MTDVRCPDEPVAREAPGSAVRSFFVPVEGADLHEQQRHYVRLRDAAGAEAGRATQRREIFRMQCRLGGRNCSMEVGGPVPGGDHVIGAIFDVGGDDRYLVYGATPEAELLLRLGKRSVYEVLEFS